MRWRGNQAASRKSNNLLQGGEPRAKPWAFSLHFVAAFSTARSSGPNLAGSWCWLTKQETPSEPPGHCSTPWDHFQEPILHSQGRLSLPGTSPHIHFCFKVVVFFPKKYFYVRTNLTQVLDQLKTFRLMQSKMLYFVYKLISQSYLPHLYKHRQANSTTCKR